MEHFMELIQRLSGPDWVTPWTFPAMALPYLWGFTGVLVHFLSRKKKGAKLPPGFFGFWKYLKADWRFTAIAVCAYSIVFFGFAKVIYMNIAISPFLALAADSLLNHYKGD